MGTKVEEVELAAHHEEQIKDLADTLYTIHGSPQSTPAQGSDYVFFIGGGASTVAPEKHTFTDQLYYQTLLQRGARPTYTIEEVEKMVPNDRLASFNDKWLRPAFAPLRQRILQNLLDKLTLTQGHQILAELLRDGYFSLLFTTAIDQMIETAFVSSLAGVKQLPHWFVPVNRFTTMQDLQVPKTVEELQRAAQAPLGPTIVKLCGDMSVPAVTSAEVMLRAQIISDNRAMGNVFQRNLVIIEPTPLDDLMLQHFAGIGDGGTPIYYISSQHPSAALKQLLKQRDPTYIVDEKINFDLALQKIYKQIRTLLEVEGLTGQPLGEENVEQMREAQKENPDEDPIVTYMSSKPSPLLAPPFLPHGHLSSHPSPQQESSSTVGERATPQAPPVDIPASPPPQHTEADEDLIELIEDDTLFEPIGTTLFTITMDPGHRVSYTGIGGKFNTSSKAPQILKIDDNSIQETMQDMRHKIVLSHRVSNKRERDSSLEIWQHDIKRLGKGLYGDLIQAYPDLEKALVRARQTALKDGPENLTLVFEGQRTDLGMPYELLYDGDTPLALGIPLCRKISDAPPRHTGHFDAFMQALRKQKQPLKILLIAAGTEGMGADHEIAYLRDRIITQMTHVKLKEPEIQYIASSQATYETVKKELTQCQYHIVHYAGQETLDDSAGTDRGLTLRHSQHSKERVVLTTAELASLLATSKTETQLFYLGNCVGVWTESDLKSYNNDYLGAMDALVRAGIPYVLGFRWYVEEERSRLFAAHFYDRLFQQPFVPERAAWYARKQSDRETGETWASSILVAQNPYR